MAGTEQLVKGLNGRGYAYLETGGNTVKTARAKFLELHVKQRVGNTSRDCAQRDVGRASRFRVSRSTHKGLSKNQVDAMTPTSS